MKPRAGYGRDMRPKSVRRRGNVARELSARHSARIRRQDWKRGAWRGFRMSPVGPDDFRRVYKRAHVDDGTLSGRTVTRVYRTAHHKPQPRYRREDNTVIDTIDHEVIKCD